MSNVGPAEVTTRKGKKRSGSLSPLKFGAFHHALLAVVAYLLERAHDKRGEETLDALQTDVRLVLHQGFPVGQGGQRDLVQTLHVVVAADQLQPAQLRAAVGDGHRVDEGRFLAVEHRFQEILRAHLSLCGRHQFAVGGVGVPLHDVLEVREVSPGFT